MFGLAKRLATACGALSLLIAATGCMRMDLELEIRPDETVGGSFTAAWSEDFLDEVASGEDPVDRAELDAFLDALIEGVPGGHREPYREDGYVGRTATFADRPLSEFAEFGDQDWGFMRLTYEDHRYVLQGRWDLRYDAAGLVFPERIEEAEILMRVNFPARVTDHNGELEGRTVVWRMSPGEDYRLHAEAREYDGWAFAAAGVASLAVVLALLWLWQWSRMRRYSR